MSTFSSIGSNDVTVIGPTVGATLYTVTSNYVGLAIFDVSGSDGGTEPEWRCSCALLSPTVVLTAGHCTDEAVQARVWFDEVVEGNLEYPFSGDTSYEEKPYFLGDTDIVLAVNSYGSNVNCAGVGYSSRVDIPEVLEWIKGFLK